MPPVKRAQETREKTAVVHAKELNSEAVSPQVEDTSAEEIVDAVDDIEVDEVPEVSIPVRISDPMIDATLSTKEEIAPVVTDANPASSPAPAPRRYEPPKAPQIVSSTVVQGRRGMERIPQDAVNQRGGAL